MFVIFAGSKQYQMNSRKDYTYRVRCINTFVALFVALFAVTSCHPEDKNRDNRSVIIYIAANNSISSYAEDCIEELKKGYIPSNGTKPDYLIVYVKYPSSAPTLTRYYLNDNQELCEDILFTYPTSQNSADADVLEQVLNDAESACPADLHGLILWSHASGWLPQGYYDNPIEQLQNLERAPYDPYSLIVKSDQSKSFAEDNYSQIEIPALSAALPQHYEFILFDCCLMGTIEVAYELKDNCDYLLFSPTEILAESFPYATMMDKLFNYENRAYALQKVCNDYYDYYQAKTGNSQSATVSLVRTSALDYLASTCATVYDNNRSKMSTVDASSVQPYFRYQKHWFYDLDDYISRIASTQEYANFTTALNNAVIYKAATAKFLSIEIKKYSGLGTYIPNPDYQYLNNYYKSLKWNQATKMVE